MAANKKTESWYSSEYGVDVTICTTQKPGESMEDFCGRHDRAVAAGREAFPE